MKNIFLFSAILCIAIIACNPLKPKGGAQQSGFNAADSIPRPTALAMIAHFKDPQVDKSTGSVPEQYTLEDSDLFKIFKIKNITRIRLLNAAHLPNDPNVLKQNKATVLVQIKQGYSSNYYYYDIESFGANRICPPPPGCSPEQ